MESSETYGPATWKQVYFKAFTEDGLEGGNSPGYNNIFEIHMPFHTTQFPYRETFLHQNKLILLIHFSMKFSKHLPCVYIEKDGDKASVKYYPLRNLGKDMGIVYIIFVTFKKE